MFENLSIASLMNRTLINIKIDREEHPELDEIYMVARQMMTREGGWPNNVFLTPDLKPFYAGGTYAADESYGRPAFPRLLEWIQYVWTTQEKDIRETADKVAESMKPFLVYAPESADKGDIAKQSQQLFSLMKEHYDERSGGFFQAPKFPHECFLSFLLGYHERAGSSEALDMVTRSLQKMASGGMYDQVACGFHRYAVDKEWYVPHFEKMLYNQAQLARLYTDAAQLSGNPWLADVAKSILDFTSGPLTDGNGAFYSGIDAETDGVEGAYYAWTAEELQTLLAPEEVQFFTLFYALADIPQFPGHKHTDGQVIIARKPLDIAAAEQDMPYVQLAGMSAQIMNKLLEARNKRKAPRLDDKIIVSWNGLMIDAFAHAGKVFNRPAYVERAAKAAHFLLEHALDNNGELKRVLAGGRAQLDATLEDYAYLIKGLISLWRADPKDSWLDAAKALMAQAGEIFGDTAGGYFYTRQSEQLLARIKSGTDSAMPNANAVMLHNMIDLFEITKDKSWRTVAERLADYFLSGNKRLLTESATVAHAALRLISPLPLAGGAGGGNSPLYPPASGGNIKTKNVVAVRAALFPTAAKPGDKCELVVTLDIKEGWHVNANPAGVEFLIPTQVEVQGKGIEIAGIIYPEPTRKADAEGGMLPVYQGRVNIAVQLKLPAKGKKRPSLKAMVRFQPCSGTTCHKVEDVSIVIPA